MRGKRVWTTAVFLVLGCGAFAGPQTLSYQGSLLGPSGGPVPDATYRMRFTLYDALSAGTALWTEQDNAVAVYRGLFSTTLGDNPPNFPAGLFSTPNLYLQIEIDLNGNAAFEPNEVYSPRQKLAGGAWAIEADRLQGRDANYFQRRVTGLAPAGRVVTGINADGTVQTRPDQMGTGDITAVNAGTGLLGGGTSGPVTLGVRFGASGTSSTAARTDHNHWGQSWSGAGVGLTLSSSNNTGLRAMTPHNSGRAVSGEAASTTGPAAGVYGLSESSAGYGVYGLGNSNTGRSVGVYGRGDGSDGYGVAAHHFWGGTGLGVWSYSGDLIRAYAGDYPASGSLRFLADQAGNVYAAGATTATAYRFNAPKTYQASLAPREFVSCVDNPDDIVTRNAWRAYISSGVAPYQATLACGVHIPQGATITELHAWVYDNDAAGDISVILSRLEVTPGMSSTSQLAQLHATVESTSNQHLSSTTVLPWSVVDNATYSYSIMVALSPSVVGQTLAVGRVWVVYTLPEVSH